MLIVYIGKFKTQGKLTFKNNKNILESFEGGRVKCTYTRKTSNVNKTKIKKLYDNKLRNK